MMVRRLHRGLALILGFFLVLHLGNHLAGLWGQDAHLAVQKVLRPLYRNPLVEPLLLAAVAVQVGLGLTLMFRRRRMTLQTLSGGYLALFLMIHVGAVMTARWQGTDTTLAFAAAGLHAHAPWPQVFALYYGLAVFAVFAHLSVPLGRRASLLAARVVLGLGAAVALALVLLLAGRITPLIIPQELIAAFP
ncbi:MAG: hypothetical protein JNN02_01375 [Tabrizicola sp.]|nr:hypothetical protein [Tabrizicola sp.]